MSAKNKEQQTLEASKPEKEGGQDDKAELKLIR